MSRTYSAGISTAYGAAVRGGYTGTYEQWCQEMAELGDNVAAVAQAKQEVTEAVEVFIDQTVPAAVGSVNSAGAAQITLVQNTGSAAVGSVNSAGAAQVASVEAKGQEVRESIPDDYSALASEVDDLKSALNNAVQSVIHGDSLQLSFAWENGNINSSGENANNNRTDFARTIGYYVPQENETLTARFVTDLTSVFTFAEYKSDGTFVGRETYGSAYPDNVKAMLSLPLTKGKKYRFGYNAPNTVVIDLTNLDSYISIAVKTAFEPIKNGLLQAKSLCGHGRVTTTQTSLNSGDTLELEDFPLYLKKGHAYSFHGWFTNFTKLIIGQGYQTYRGKWLEIDSTNVVVKQFDTEENTVGTIAHGLTISSFIVISMQIGNDGYGKCTLTTETGSFSHDFNMGYEINGAYFATPAQNMGGIIFNVVGKDLTKPLWIFGDSYMGVTNNRIAGQLKNFGYFDGFLIHALAGQDSEEAFAELQKALALGTPKFLLWCLGMNDSSAEKYTTIMEQVKSICAEKSIELILYRVPTVPSRASITEAIGTAVLNSGLRYINAYRAVETNASGEWAEGMLSTDGIHPTELGAQSIASRFLVDVPEIMEY